MALARAINSIYLDETRASASLRAFPVGQVPEFEDLLPPLLEALPTSKVLQKVAAKVDTETMFDRWILATRRIDYIFCNSVFLGVSEVFEAISQLHEVFVSQRFLIFGSAFANSRLSVACSTTYTRWTIPCRFQWVGSFVVRS